MKKVLFPSILSLLIGLVACQKKDDTNNAVATAQPAPVAVNNQTYATTPQPCNAGNTYQTTQNGQVYYYSYTNTGLVQTQNGCNNYNNWYNNGNWNQQYSYGSWYWPNQWQPQTGYCGCPLGYNPVFSPTYGVACAPIAYFNSYVVYYNNNWFQGAAQNTLPLNTPQTQYVGPSTTSSCYNTAAQGCDVRLNTCPAGTVCQPTGGGSTIGLCVRAQ
ncbi:MAG: hypothetical protein BroJett040_22170 [Oligoflexia bacterium]|nr:MAG: hypothetical protein BroJett040_22170 [Oligoflexia bacterium]